ncbi:unnamed protein product [Strongylus vulgaris]|uniref:Uncharacterized protein n=1 Tax=Strongylus vulgaris TaxID=40348 RepID=A0A3P7JPD3_STRVU|nr:unnamed protein product [Strongylus vulgaris]
MTCSCSAAVPPGCTCDAAIPPGCTCDGIRQVCPDACYYSCEKQEELKGSDAKKKNEYKFIIPNELATTTQEPDLSLMPYKQTKSTLFPTPVEVPSEPKY